MDFVWTELERMSVHADTVELIREKDGVTVARVRSGDRTGVFKGFKQRDFRREIVNYLALQELGVPTLRVLAHSGAALLLEDMDTSSRWRLGIEDDMDDPAVARALAIWYRRLHDAGYAYVRVHGKGLYDENDVITRENLAVIQERTGTAALPVWTLLDKNFERLTACIRSARQTLTYNDFYYTNLAVARDGSAAMMFDYNLLGKGYAYADVRNVCTSLSARAGEAFMRSYGVWDAREQLIDEVASVLVTLHFACQRETFPTWAQDTLESLRGDYAQTVERLLREAR